MDYHSNQNEFLDAIMDLRRLTSLTAQEQCNNIHTFMTDLIALVNSRETTKDRIEEMDALITQITKSSVVIGDEVKKKLGIKTD